MATVSLTTLDAVKATAPDLVDGIADTTLTQDMNDAHIAVIGDGFPASIMIDGEDIGSAIKEQAERYYTLHMLSTDSESARGIQSEEVDVIKTSYFASNVTNEKWIKSSLWGKLYWDLWKKYGRGKRDFNFLVVNH